MTSPLTLENCLLLACARTEPDVPRLQELVERGPDWQEILRKTECWGLAPLVYTNLRQAAQAGYMPQPVVERLRHFYRRDTVHNVVRRELLRATLLRFVAARIPVIVLKGAALATLVYPSPGLRPMGDIDLLVHRRDQERVEAVLRGLRDGAEPDAPFGGPPLDPKRLALLDIRQDIFSAWSAADGLSAAGCIPIEDFWERARPAQIESVATLVFSPEDLLLYLAFHLTEETGFGGQVRTLCDIGEVCRWYRDAIEWRQLVARARSYNIAKPLYYALRLARELVRADVPPGALTEVRASFGQLPLEERLIAAVTRRAILSEDEAMGPLSTFYRLAVHLLATRRARDGAVIACRLLARACQGRLRRLVTGTGLGRARFTGPGNEALNSNSSRKRGKTTAHPSQGEHGDLEAGEVATEIRRHMVGQNEALDRMTTLKVSHEAGLTSCLSVRLHEVSKYRAEHGLYPDQVDSSDQFQRYRDKEAENIAEVLLAPVCSMKDDPHIHFDHDHQFAWYGDLNLPALYRLARNYCWPSKRVVEEAYSIMRSMQGRTAVLYRGNDKIRETPRTPYEKMFEMAELSGAQLFWVQTDEADFFDAFEARFPNTKRIEELPMIRRNDTACILPKTGRAEFASKFLASLYAIAQAPQIICTTGNTAVWPMIFRGHTRGVWQYFSPYNTFRWPNLDS